MKRRSGLARVVVDTNLVVSGLILERGVPSELIAALRAGRFLLVISEPIRLEYERVLARPRFATKYGLTGAEVASFLSFLDTVAVRVAPRRRLPVSVRDSGDDIILAAALGGRAEYLVTGDADILALRDDPRLRGLRILTAREFLATLDPGEYV